MNSTFFRAVVGFIILTASLVLMAITALWSIETYAQEFMWVSVLVIIIALATEIGVYRSTLHTPIHDWIRAPERERERLANEARKPKPSD